MANTHETREMGDTLAILEDIAGHAISLALVSVDNMSATWSANIRRRVESIHSTTSATSGDTSGILTSVLEIVEGFMKVHSGNILARLVLPVAEYEADNSTHGELALTY